MSHYGAISHLPTIYFSQVHIELNEMKQKLTTFWTIKKDPTDLINNSHTKTWNMTWPYGPNIVADRLYEESIMTLSLSAHALEEHPHTDSRLGFIATWHLQKLERVNVCAISFLFNQGHCWRKSLGKFTGELWKLTAKLRPCDRSSCTACGLPYDPTQEGLIQCICNIHNRHTGRTGSHPIDTIVKRSYYSFKPFHSAGSSVFEIRDYVWMLQSWISVILNKESTCFKELSSSRRSGKYIPYKLTLEYKEVVLNPMLLYFAFKIQPLNIHNLHERNLIISKEKYIGMHASYWLLILVSQLTSCL